MKKMKEHAHIHVQHIEFNFSLAVGHLVMYQQPYLQLYYTDHMQ